MTLFVTTNPGVRSVIHIGTNGPFHHLLSYKVGSAHGYTPIVTDTDIHGTLLDSGSVTSYTYQSPDLAIFQIDIPAPDGPFDVGEVGIYTSDGTLYALLAYTELQNKPIGTSIRIYAKFQIKQVTADVILSNAPVNKATLLEVPNLSYVNNVPSSADTNAYITHSHDDSNQTAVIVVRHDNNSWDIPSHPFDIVDGSCTSGSSTTVVHTTSATVIEASPSSGKYVIEFTSGANIGLLRLITASNGTTTVTVDIALPNAPANTDTFSIYQSLYSFISRKYAAAVTAGYAVLLTDTKKIITLTTSGNVQLPAASSVGLPFSVIIFNKSSGNVNVTLTGGDHIVANGLATNAPLALPLIGDAAEFMKIDSSHYAGLLYQQY